MLTFISRTVGTSIVLGLAAVGLKSVAGEVINWKRAYDASTNR